MKILHAISDLNPAGGGPQVIALSLAAGQAGLGHEVTLATTLDEAGAKWLEGRRKAVPGLDRVKIQNVGISGGKAAVLLGRATSPELDKMIAAHEAVHLHSVWDPIVRVAGDSARRQGKPYFILLNGMLDPWSLSQSKWKKKLAMALGYRRLFNGAAALHLGNRDERELIAPLKLGCGSEIIPNGMFIEEVTPLPERGKFVAKHPQLAGRKFVLFLSRLHYKKGLDYLAGAFEVVARALPEVMLVVAGPEGGAEVDFKQRIASAGLNDRVILPGPIFGGAKFEALVDATCFCLPSRQEGFSMAITEALACGTPVVISENCHFPEVAEARAGAVVKLEAELVGRALIDVLDSDRLRAEQSANAARLIRERYTWPKIAEMAVAMYRKHGKVAG